MKLKSLLMAGILSVSMVIAPIQVANAADGDAPSVVTTELTAGTDHVVTTGTTVTISGIPTIKDKDSEVVGDYYSIATKPSVSGITFTTYQVVTTSYDAESNDLAYVLTDWAKSALVTSGKYANENAALQAIQAISKSDNGATTEGTSVNEQHVLTNYLMSYAKTNGDSVATVDAGWEQSSTDKSKATAELPVGAYIVSAESTTMAFLNMLVSVDVDSQAPYSDSDWIVNAKNAVLKGSCLSIDKVIDENGKRTASAAIGDVLGFTVTADVPAYPEDATNTLFQVVDTPVNLAIDVDSVSVKAGDVDLTDKASISVDENTGVLTVDFSETYKANFTKTNSATGVVTYLYDTLTVKYNAELLSSALTGDDNVNNVDLVYTTAPYTTKGTNETIIHDYPDDPDAPSTHVFTYEMDVTKYAYDANKTNHLGAPLQNTEFKLLKGNTVIPVIKNNDGTFSVADSTVEEKDYATITTDADGKFVIIGLDADVEYTMKETKAPSGYSLNKELYVFTITAKDAADVVTKAILEVNDQRAQDSSWAAPDLTNAAAGSFATNLTDTKLINLPHTGGYGTVIFAIIGGVAMMTGVIVLFLYMKKKDEEDENA